MTNGKVPFEISRVLRAIRPCVRRFPKAALFDLRDRGFGEPFEILAACILSIRTYDEVSLVAALGLFKKARTAKQLLKLTDEELANLISPCTFAFQKAANLKKIAKILVQEYDGKVVCDFDFLTALPGIGPKCAGLILGIACDQPAISVDVHVHRVTNRWGYVQAPTPEKTWRQLREKLPKRYWVTINELLVPFGKHICKGSRPLCERCPVLASCRQIGVSPAIRRQSEPAMRETHSV